MKQERSRKELFKSTILTVVALAFFAAPSAFAEGTNDIRTLAELQQKISAFISQHRFGGAIWGIKVVSLDTEKTLFETNADRLMSPASNCKMLTGALALDHFGGDYRIATPIYATAKPNRRGTIHGDLIIEGRGDPTWNSHRFDTNFWAPIELFVAALTNAGVHKVTGDLVADASYFHGQPTGGSLTLDDFENGECPYISPLTINDGLAHVSVAATTVGAPCQLTMLQPNAGLVFSNCTMTVAGGGRHYIDYYMPYGEKYIYVYGDLPIDKTNETLDIPVLDPARWFGACLKEALARHGIKISGKVRSVAWPQSSALDTNDVKLGEVLSPPMRQVVKLYMKPSQNLENDIVLADIGEATRTNGMSPWRTSEGLGLAAMKDFLDNNDVRTDADTTSDEVHFDEGSGLSGDNLATPDLFTALLVFMARHPAAQDFMNSLPIAAEDGTLIHRFHHTPAAGNIRAKTGTLRWANSLSGYVTSAAGEHLAFSLLLNRYEPPPGYEKRNELDEVALMLTDFSGGSMPSPEAQEAEFAPLGRLLFPHLATAPFPDPVRANGHWYHHHTQFYSPSHYLNNTVGIFIPQDFRVTDKVDFLVHFYGYRHTVPGTLEQYKLIDQFAASGKNAILVVPTGPYDAADPCEGKLEDTNGFARFMADVVATIKNSGALANTNFEVGNIILTSHSGGYEAVYSIVDHGGLTDHIREVWLFDSLYDGTEIFKAWQKAQNGRFVDLYTDYGGTEWNTADLMAFYKKNGGSFFFSEDTNATPQDLRGNRLVFLHTNLAHDDTPVKRRAFQEFLETSCFENK